MDKTGPYELESLQFVGGTNPISQATVLLICGGYYKKDSGNGDCIVGAVFNTIHKIVGSDVELQQKNVRFMNGSENKFEFSVTLTKDEKVFYGKGLHDDVITAAALAYVDGLNKIEAGDQESSEKDSLLEL